MPNGNPAVERIPIQEALPGITIHSLDEPADFVFVLARSTDADGRTGWAFRTSAAPNREELLGALVVQVAILRTELAEDWEL